MPHPSTLAVGSLSQVSAATPSALAASGSAPHVAPDILTYCYASRLVYVTPGESYDVRLCPHNVSFPFLLIDFTRPSMLLKSPRSPSLSSRTSNASGSPWRSMSCSKTNNSTGLQRSGGRPGLSWLHRSSGSKLWKYASRVNFSKFLR